MPADTLTFLAVELATLRGRRHIANRLLSPPLKLNPAVHRSFLTKEDIYPSSSFESGSASTCNKGRLERVALADKVRLTGGGFQQLQPWSATALRQVRARFGGAAVA